jgi:hypothetical protein
MKALLAIFFCGLVTGLSAPSHEETNGKLKLGDPIPA